MLADKEMINIHFVATEFFSVGDFGVAGPVPMSDGGATIGIAEVDCEGNMISPKAF
jgi:hypothetical protein